MQSSNNILQWIKSRRGQMNMEVTPIPFSELIDWYFSSKGNLVHKSGRFFQIKGIRARTNWGDISQWSQPIIYQPEIGILGFLIRKDDKNQIQILFQAKVEPGNIGNVQLSPTFQATESNYSQVHKGTKPHFYKDFLIPSKKLKLVSNQLQSEQGARFKQKRNRNVIYQVTDSHDYPDNFMWISLKNIHSLLQKNNVINMDSRSVLSSLAHLDEIQLGPLWEGTNSLYSNVEVLSWITQMKVKYSLKTRLIGLNKVEDWIKTENEIVHKSGNFFRVIAVSVKADSREVGMWTQPMIAPAGQGVIAFIIKKINGTYHFLVRAKLEAGNLDIVELAPTVQCITGNYKNVPDDEWPDYLKYVLSASKKQIIYDTLQSEEGGRFYREENRNVLILAEDSFDVESGSDFCWMSFPQMVNLLQYNNFFNIQARSLITAALFCFYPK